MMRMKQSLKTGRVPQEPYLNKPYQIYCEARAGFRIDGDVESYQDVEVAKMWSHIIEGSQALSYFSQRNGGGSLG